MKDTSDKKKIIILGSVLLVILVALGITYAYLRTTLEGQKDYVIRAGTLDLILTEDNELTLEKQIPIEDSEGIALNGFNFSLTNEGNIDTDYTIYLDDIPLDEGETRIPDSAIRYSLTRNEEVIGPKDLTTMGSDPNRRVDFGTIAVDETINYTLRIWIDYDATKEEASGKTFKGKLRVVATQEVPKAGDTILAGLTSGSTYDDGTDTFITGTDPNNYIWYSGKLWRAVSVNNEAKTTKLVTQWDISSITYSSGSTDFAGSYMEEWLNDTSVDGFLGNLRDYENFIVTGAKWNATLDATALGSITKPSDDGTVVTDAVGLLNMYEYQSSNNGGTDSYLNNGLSWWTLTPYSSSYVRRVNSYGSASDYSPSGNSYGARPSINLKSSVRIVDGDGTIDNPYRLNGDNDTNLSGTLLSSRYSGEYIRFGNNENNLYRIVSHENGTGTKIVSAEPLKSSGTFITMNFGSNTTFSSTNTVGTFLNGEYLTNYVDSTYIDMIEDSTTWYLGTVGSGSSYSYKNAKYTDASGTATTSNVAEAKVGLLRFGELMAGQFDRYGNNTYYWTLTPYSSSRVRFVNGNGYADYNSPSSAPYGARPSMNLKSSVQITSGTGTKTDPFTLELAS